jgi:hypothetical protein
MPLRSEYVDCITVNQGGVLAPLAGIDATVYEINPDGSQGSQYTPFAGLTGSTQASSTATDSNGNISFFLDGGEYRIDFADSQSPARIAPFSRYFAALTFSEAQLIAASAPQKVGEIRFYGGTTDPVDSDGTTRNMICDGRPLNRSTYSDLFGVFAETFGAGDGSTTFNIPDITLGPPASGLKFIVRVLV